MGCLEGIHQVSEVVECGSTQRMRSYLWHLLGETILASLSLSVVTMQPTDRFKPTDCNKVCNQVCAARGSCMLLHVASRS